MRRRLAICALWLALLAGTGMGTARWLLPAVCRTWARLGDLVGVSGPHAGPTVDQLLPLASLTVLRVQVSDVAQTRFHGTTGGITATIVVKGDVELSTDLAAARLLDVDEANRTAVLVLPQPRASRPRVDHERTRIVALARDGLWTVVPGDYADQVVVNRAYAGAEQTVAVAAEGAAVRARARAQAEHVLGAFFESIGWRVRVHWDDRP